MYENTTNQLSNFRTKTGVKINHDACGMSNTHIQIKFKSTMLKTGLCDYCGAQMLAKGAITLANTAAANADTNYTNKKECLKVELHLLIVWAK